MRAQEKRRAAWRGGACGSRARVAAGRVPAGPAVWPQPRGAPRGTARRTDAAAGRDRGPRAAAHGGHGRRCGRRGPGRGPRRRSSNDGAHGVPPRRDQGRPVASAGTPMGTPPNPPSTPTPSNSHHALDVAAGRGGCDDGAKADPERGAAACFCRHIGPPGAGPAGACPGRGACSGRARRCAAVRHLDGRGHRRRGLRARRRRRRSELGRLLFGAKVLVRGMGAALRRRALCGH